MALLSVRSLVKEFSRGRGWWGRPGVVRAVDRVSFDVESGETFGLVGESGSGKTTTGRCILRLIEPTSGEVWFKDRDVLGLPADELRRARRDMQIVFQDPYSSLNPRMRARRIVEEPLVIHKLGTKGERRDRVAELFRLVGLDPAHLDRYPHEFSGGQRQRIGLARALALNPSLDRRRRARVGARRLRAGPGRQPADGPAGAADAHLPVHRPRPEAGRAHLQPGGGDVPRPDPRDGPDRRRCSRTRPIPTRAPCSRRSPSPTRTPGRSGLTGIRTGADLRRAAQGSRGGTLRGGVSGCPSTRPGGRRPRSSRP